MWLVQALDKYQNPVSAGEQVRVALEGFEVQDKNGYMRSVSSFFPSSTLHNVQVFKQQLKMELRFEYVNTTQTHVLVVQHRNSTLEANSQV